MCVKLIVRSNIIILKVTQNFSCSIHYSNAHYFSLNSSKVEVKHQSMETLKQSTCRCLLSYLAFVSASPCDFKI